MMAGSRMLLVGVAVRALGVGPLLLYILLGPADGNPVGLGLLAMVAVPVGLGCAGFGLIRMLIERLAGRSA